MFDKRLFQLAPGIGKLVAGKVALMWIGLLANIGFMLSLVMLLQGLLAAADPHAFACSTASQADCPATLFAVPGTSVMPMAGGLLVALLTAAAAALAIRFAGANLHDIPALLAAFVLLASSFGPTLALSALPANLTQTFASARRLFGLMDEAPAVVETGTAVVSYEGMRLDDVTFAYPVEDNGVRASAVAGSVADDAARLASDSAEGKPARGVDSTVAPVSGADSTVGVPAWDAGSATGATILSDFSLDIPQHGVFGVQGPSGRGKSTILKMLMRYWDPQSGQVTLSGTPLPQIDVHCRRRVQAMMSQETHLFDGTIRDNLLLALPEQLAQPAVESYDSLLREALAKASVLGLIDSLPDGLDTQVGELGDRLSEGERQRIGLARVFLRNADLVLFDEPTSRLDALNEAIILRSIHEMAAGRAAAADDVTGEAHEAADHGVSHESQAQTTRGDATRTSGAAVVLVSHRESAMRIADNVLAL